MSSFPGTPKLIRGGIVLLDPVTGSQQKVIPLQYNPEQLTRTLSPKWDADSDKHHADPLRLMGPPVETIKLDAEIDATDDLEFPDNNSDAVQMGIGPALAVLELIVYPTSDALQQTDSLADSGQLEVVPPDGPLVVFVWGRGRVIPVKITEFSILEQAFDPNLNPTLAKVSLGMTVLTAVDLGFSSKGGSLYLSYQKEKERQASQARGAGIGAVGLERI